MTRFAIIPRSAAANHRSWRRRSLPTPPCLAPHRFPKVPGGMRRRSAVIAQPPCSAPHHFRKVPGGMRQRSAVLPKPPCSAWRQFWKVTRVCGQKKASFNPIITPYFKIRFSAQKKFQSPKNRYRAQSAKIVSESKTQKKLQLCAQYPFLSPKPNSESKNRF